MLNVTNVVSEAWRHFTAQWQGWILIGIVYSILLVVSLFTCVGIFIFYGPLTAGLYVAAIKQLRGGRVEINDLWGGFQFFGSSFVLWFLSSLVIALGLIFLIIPGLIFAVWFSMAFACVVADNVGGVEAMGRSKRAVSGQFWQVAFLMAVLFFIQMIASYVPIVGPAAGTALMVLSMAIAHRDLIGLPGALPPLTDAPAAPPPQPTGLRACPRCNAGNFATARFCAACGGQMA